MSAGCRDKLPKVAPWEEGVKRLANPKEWGRPGCMEGAQGKAARCRGWTLADVHRDPELGPGVEGGPGSLPVTAVVAL